jgi:predicted RND superfamily exporter protein
LVLAFPWRRLAKLFASLVVLGFGVAWVAVGFAWEGQKCSTGSLSLVVAQNFQTFAIFL